MATTSTSSSSAVLIGGTTYDLQEKFMPVAAKYFNISDMNLLKVGLFGYINETMSMIGRDGVFHRDTLYDEQFLNTASMPRSIYNQAKIFNYNIAGSTPASMEIVFFLKKSDIIKYSTDAGSGLKEFTVDKSNQFSIGGYPFTLEYSVSITAKPSVDVVGDYSMTAQYILETDHTALETLATPYIKTWTETHGGEDFIYLQLKIWQMKLSTTSFTVYSQDVSDNLIYTTSYTDQLVYFTVEYTYNGTTTILPAYFDDSYTPTDVDQYCYFTYPDDGTLQIFFSGLPGAFRPNFNSTLTLNMYVSQGATGNFSYNGNVLFQFSDTKLQSVSALVTPLTDSAGGQDKPTLKALKQALIQESLVRDNLITETDLSIFFNQIINSTSVNNSTLQFVKKRDDILRRIFAAFLLLRNSKGYIIPTNTVSVYTSMDWVEENNFTVPAGSIVIYDGTLQQYRFLRSDEYPEDYVSTDGIIMYSIPFLMAIAMDPFPRITYYQTTVNADYSFDYTYVNPNVTYEFLISKMTVSRNSFLDNAYTFTTNLNTTLDKDSVVNNLILRALLMKDGQAYGYFDFSLNDLQDYGYTASITTDDTFDSDGNIAIVNSIKDVITGEVIPKVYVGEGMTIEIATLYNGSSTEKTKYTDFAGMNDIVDYATTNTFTASTTVDIFRSLSQLMQSDLLIDSTGAVQIKGIPVVSTKYFNNSANYTDLYTIMDAYSMTLQDNFDKLQNNTGIDMKFYNTYGVCQYSSIDTTNLRIGLAIKLSTSYTKDLDTSIKQLVMQMVENANSTSGNGLLAISNIITQLQNTFSEIEYVEFKHLNGVNQQKVQYLYPNFDGLTSEQLINYVPEYLNISMGSTDSSSFNPDIDIQYT